MPKRYRMRGSQYEFSPCGGPIDEPDQNAELFVAIGLATAAWGRMEHLLTALVMHLNKAGASEALHDPDPPNAFKRKVKLFEKWINTHPAYSHLKTNGTFFESLRELADHRNRIAHGHIRSIDKEADTLTIGLLSRSGKDAWSYGTCIMEIPAISEISALANIANRYFTSVADEVFLPDPDEQSQTP